MPSKKEDVLLLYGIFSLQGQKPTKSRQNIAMFRDFPVFSRRFQGYDFLILRHKICVKLECFIEIQLWICRFHSWFGRVQGSTTSKNFGFSFLENLLVAFSCSGFKTRPAAAIKAPNPNISQAFSAQVFAQEI